MTKPNAEKLASLEWELEQIMADAHGFEERYRLQLDQLHPDQLKSGLNLLHYLALRRRNVEGLQEDLSSLGLSSLGRAEGHVLSHLHAVHHALRSLQRHKSKRRKGPVTLKKGRRILRGNTNALLGKKLKGSPVRIMVTLPSEAADDPDLVRGLLEAGMNCARINCAHDGPAEWERMIRHLHRAKKATGRACRTFMDLGGPKIRTGALTPGDRVQAIRTTKNCRGVVEEPVTVVLVPERPAGPSADPAPPVSSDDLPIVPVSSELFTRLRAGDRLEFEDTRGKSARLDVVSIEGAEARATSSSTVYLETGMRLSLARGGDSPPLHGVVGALPPLDVPIVLQVGDTLVIHGDPRPGEPACRGQDGVMVPAHVSCTLPEVLNDVRVGEAVLLDDGKARGFIRSVNDSEMVVEITHARMEGMKLRGNKGINLPDSRLRVAGLTPQDREDLRFVVAHADGVNVSFVNHPDDVEDLLDEMEALGGHHLGLVLKIETRRGFQHLPGILLAAMEWPLVGVMIARGDLAVEGGWTHLARMQEEILWVCEAAHTPVIWATEVLDRLAKKGMPTRSEISDVVMAERAECVMLNKGPYIVQAIRTLDAVLSSMQGYQHKKTTLLPALTLDDPDPEEVGRAVGLRQGRWKAD